MPREGVDRSGRIIVNLRRLLGLGRSREFDLSKAFNDLGIRLLRDENPEKNCFLSPLSIGLALSMLPAGARGRTRRELENLLGVPNGACELGPLVEERIARLSAPRESKGRAVKFALHMANALFVRRGYRLREDYVERLRRHWDSECRPVDFEKAEEAAARINDWVAEQTNDLIKELVSSDDLDVETRLVLVNAIYFQGEWLFPFDDFLTESEPFFGSVHRDRAIVKAAIMKKTHEYPYYTDEHLDALELPFDSMSMLVLAPKRGSLAKLEEWVSTDEIWKTADMMRERRLELRIPRFSMEASFSMGRRLQDYGLRLAFSEKADFSGITDDPAGLMISKVLHRAHRTE